MLCFVTNVKSQNLDKIGKEDALTVSGNLNETMIIASSAGKVQQREPFSVVSKGSLTVTFLDIALPFSFIYSNKQLSYHQPFNRIRFAPTYKWAKINVGDIALQVSPYLGSGQTVHGIGLELSPKSWQFKSYVGIIRQATQADVNSGLKWQSANRKLYGVEIFRTMGRRQLHIGLINAWDDFSTSVSDNVAAQKSNIAIAVDYDCYLGKKVQLKINQGISLVTDHHHDLQNTLFDYKIMSYNATSKWYKATKLSLNIPLNQYTVKISAEHIDADYNTLASSYFQNDLQYAGIGLQHQISKRWNYAIMTALQRNNLLGKMAKSNMRSRINFSFSGQLGEKIFITGNYSNLTAITRTNPDYRDWSFYQNIDTLNFYQIQQAATLSFFFQEKAKRRKWALNTGFSKSQQMHQESYSLSLPNDTTSVFVINNAFSFSQVVADKKFNWTIAVNSLSRIFQHRQQINYGGTLRVNYKISNRFSIGETSQLITPDKFYHATVSHALTGGFSFKTGGSSKQQLSMQTRLLLQQKLAVAHYYDLLFNITLNYSF